MEEYFTYKSKYGEYHNCYFNVGVYENGNLAVEIFSNEEGPITKVTVNPDIPIKSRTLIAIKDYSENEGMVDWMYSMGLIAKDPINVINSGWVKIPVHRLTAKGIDAFRGRDFRGEE